MGAQVLPLDPLPNPRGSQGGSPQQIARCQSEQSATTAEQTFLGQCVVLEMQSPTPGCRGGFKPWEANFEGSMGGAQRETEKGRASDDTTTPTGRGQNASKNQMNMTWRCPGK